ncbi:hypothetical protein L1987_16618 [Smallanthus sonchifolius]|uniref:Uncharacterized protein n=1 Tax=Smallanthus sonchifolius TaxID=185202 RepID=A0ACB9IVQ3_9ASTR|nr:hypothetical protein L1987_16618 [Smallanthus sonchifolius]
MHPSSFSAPPFALVPLAFLGSLISGRSQLRRRDSGGMDFSKIDHRLERGQFLALLVLLCNLHLTNWADFSGPKFDCKITYDLLDYQRKLALSSLQECNLLRLMNYAHVSEMAGRISRIQVSMGPLIGRSLYGGIDNVILNNILKSACTDYLSCILQIKLQETEHSLFDNQENHRRSNVTVKERISYLQPSKIWWVEGDALDLQWIGLPVEAEED